jgi:nitroreductase
MTPLEQAAHAARHAPSIFNTQPWSWRVTGDTMELFAEPDRRVESIDPDGRLLLLSCGAALHHARVALGAAGRAVHIERLPDPANPALLARVTAGAEVPPDPEGRRMAAAIERRHTDRRAFGDRVVTGDELTRLRRFVEYEGAYLHVVPHEDVPALAIGTELAGRAELGDPSYRADLERWTNRPGHTGDGVPPATAVVPGLRRVPVRDFFPGGGAGPDTPVEHDQGAAYVILFGAGDDRIDLLRGGEALSTLLLLATADGLATAPLSDAVEVAWPRHLLRSLLADVGEPYLVVRLGYAPDRKPVPTAPRRAPHEVITGTD